MAEHFAAINGAFKLNVLQPLTELLSGGFKPLMGGYGSINGRPSMVVKRPFKEAIKGRASSQTKPSSQQLSFSSLCSVLSRLSCFLSISSLVIVRSLSSSSPEAVFVGVQVLLVRRCILGNRRSTYSQNTRGEGESVLRKACSSRASAIFPLYFFIF